MAGYNSGRGRGGGSEEPVAEPGELNAGARAAVVAGAYAFVGPLQEGEKYSDWRAALNDAAIQIAADCGAFTGLGRTVENMLGARTVIQEEILDVQYLGEDSARYAITFRRKKPKPKNFKSSAPMEDTFNTGREDAMNKLDARNVKRIVAAAEKGIGHRCKVWLRTEERDGDRYTEIAHLEVYGKATPPGR